jgi:PAS domain S-box-containing protein
LDQRTQELNAILSSVQDYLYILDPEGHFIFANKKLLDLWGLSSDQAFGRSMRDLQYPAEVEATLLAGIQHVSRTGEVVTNETCYTGAAGIPGFYENILAPIYDTEGHITGIAGSSRDITDRKHSEEQAKLYSQFQKENPNPVLRCGIDGDPMYFNGPARQWLATFGWRNDDTLPEPVREAVAMATGRGHVVEVDITNPLGRVFSFSAIQPPNETYVNLYGIDVTERELARESLERSNRDLEQFAYVASHDLQEPLRAIVGFLQLFESRYKARVDEKGRHYIERSVKAAHRMQQLIRELLTLSRVHTKGSILVPTDLNQLLKGVLDNLQELVREKNAEVNCGLLPMVNIDAAQIGSLFQNLLVNALHYNQSPTPRVEIGYQELDDSYRFRVQDNGIGIPPQFAQRIFLVFQRLHTEQEYTGTGLGLALCKRIVERHGGAIWFEPNPSEGTTFYFTLPKEAYQS